MFLPGLYPVKSAVHRCARQTSSPAVAQLPSSSLSISAQHSPSVEKPPGHTQTSPLNLVAEKVLNCQLALMQQFGQSSGLISTDFKHLPFLSHFSILADAERTVSSVNGFP
jgi:hypothetical protein